MARQVSRRSELSVGAVAVLCACTRREVMAAIEQGGIRPSSWATPTQPRFTPEEAISFRQALKLRARTATPSASTVEIPDLWTSDGDQLRLLMAVAVTANDAVLITESEPVVLPGPRIVYVNDAFTRMTGYTPADIIGQTPRILQGLDSDRAELDRIARALRRWKPVRATVKNYRKDGAPFWVEFSIVPMANQHGWYTHWISIQRDVTNSLLARAELERAYANIEQAVRARDQFLSRMSHELRTPLNAILGFAQLLDMEESLGPSDHECLRHILDGGAHLLRLIDDVLDISTIEQGRVSMVQMAVPAGEMVRQARLLVTPLDTDYGVALSTDEAEDSAILIWADPQRLTQILVNLLSNAVKYTGVGGSVQVAVERRDDDASVRIAVIDSGRGIPDHRLPRLFTPFDRLGAEQTTVPGTGLGLALSRRLARHMGGDIGVRSVEGVGSTFWVDLPAPPMAAQMGDSAHAP